MCYVWVVSKWRDEMTTIEKAYTALYNHVYGEDRTGEVADWIEFGCDDIAETAETIADFEESGWKVDGEDENGVVDIFKPYYNARRGKEAHHMIHIYDAGDKRYVYR